MVFDEIEVLFGAQPIQTQHIVIIIYTAYCLHKTSWSYIINKNKIKTTTKINLFSLPCLALAVVTNLLRWTGTHFVFFYFVKFCSLSLRAIGFPQKKHHICDMMCNHQEHNNGRSSSKWKCLTPKSGGGGWIFGYIWRMLLYLVKGLLSLSTRTGDGGCP